MPFALMYTSKNYKVNLLKDPFEFEVDVTVSNN